MMDAAPGQQFPPPNPSNFLQQLHVPTALPLVPPPLSSNSPPRTWASGNWNMCPINVASMPLELVLPIPAPQLSSRMPSVTEELRAQIEYYFSNANLCHDMFLRRQMGLVDGYVSLIVLSKFPRVQKFCATDFTFDIVNYIRGAIESSNELEMNTMMTKVRRKSDWMEWILC